MKLALTTPSTDVAWRHVLGRLRACSRGGEIRKLRPAVIVSNDAANRAQNRVQVIPLTTNVTRIRRWEAPVHVNGAPHKAMADQIRTVAKERLSRRMGSISPTDLLAVEQAIRVQLGLP